MGIKFFASECVDIVERGRANKIEVSRIVIEGVYKGEIFRYGYVPKEEGYGPEEEQEGTL
jgi:hypothetical protein